MKTKDVDIIISAKHSKSDALHVFYIGDDKIRFVVSMNTARAKDDLKFQLREHLDLIVEKLMDGMEDGNF